jgi:hypothetical protein
VKKLDIVMQCHLTILTFLLCIWGLKVIAIVGDTDKAGGELVTVLEKLIQNLSG